MIWLKRTAYGMVALANLLFAFDYLSIAGNDCLLQIAVPAALLGILFHVLYFVLWLVNKIRGMRNKEDHSCSQREKEANEENQP